MNQRVDDINPEDIPEIAFPRSLLITEPPEDQYKLMVEVDGWAAKQCIEDTKGKPFALAWLGLSEQQRIDYCEAYYGAVQDRNLP